MTVSVIVHSPRACAAAAIALLADWRLLLSGAACAWCEHTGVSNGSVRRRHWLTQIEPSRHKEARQEFTGAPGS